ncbi:hypothetical protein [Frigoribacterium sp. SL97]|uniref:hypothetical protein n=1 Tax=Frigoribacterium sp. SL97 TaxID=2994664 RepID=UPI0022711AC1|nr:hypothetical protein [Frigoribacterium sp. SL97]WAC50378.1 hypothetical protein OVA02_10785 [Frigoribacterium sp. SL97]
MLNHDSLIANLKAEATPAALQAAAALTDLDQKLATVRGLHVKEEFGGDCVACGETAGAQGCPTTQIINAGEDPADVAEASVDISTGIAELEDFLRRTADDDGLHLA